MTNRPIRSNAPRLSLISCSLFYSNANKDAPVFSCERQRSVDGSHNANGQQHFHGDIHDDPLSLLLSFLFMLQEKVEKSWPIVQAR